MAMIWNCVCCS